MKCINLKIVWIFITNLLITTTTATDNLEQAPKLELLSVDQNESTEKIHSLLIIDPKTGETHKDFILDMKNMTSSKSFIRLRCSNNYPVQLNYSGQGVPIGLIENKRLTESNLSEISNVSQINLTFSTSFQFSLLEQNTGEYSCCSNHGKEINQCSKIYLFIPGKEKFLLSAHSNLKESYGIYSQILTPSQNSNHDNETETEDEEINKNKYEYHQNLDIFETPRYLIEIEREAKFIQFSCATSTPFINISSFLQVKNKSTTQKTLLKGHFDPKTGMKVDAKDLESIEGLYMCTDGENSLSFQVKIKPKRELTIRHDLHESTFACHTTTKSLISYGIINCNSPMDCNFATSRIRNTFKPPMKLLEANSEIKLQYNSEPHLIDVRHVKKLRTPLISTGIFYCSSGDGDFKHVNFIVDYRTSQFVLTVVDNEWTTKSESDVSHFLTLTPSISKMESKSYQCFANTAITSSGIIWATEDNDGQVQFHPSDEEWIDYKNGYIKSELVDVFPLNTVRAVHCYAPVLHSGTEWRKTILINTIINVKGIILKTVAFNVIIWMIYGGMVVHFMRQYGRQGMLAKILALQLIIMVGFVLLKLSFGD